MFGPEWSSADSLLKNIKCKTYNMISIPTFSHRSERKLENSKNKQVVCQTLQREDFKIRKIRFFVKATSSYICLHYSRIGMFKIGFISCQDLFVICQKMEKKF